MYDSIGLFGGTFDPVHKGHEAIARSFIKSGFINELWVLLTPYPPHKRDKDHTSYELRYRMLNAAMGEMDKVSILTIENELEQPSYSINTIRHLKSLHPAKKFMFCMGEDSLSGFHTWKEYESILKEVDLLVATRPGASHSEVDPEIFRKVQFVEHTPVHCSSTSIKEKLKRGMLVDDMVNEKVLEIIRRESLYT